MKIYMNRKRSGVDENAEIDTIYAGKKLVS